jgi:chaperonin cofactor prefoldin
MDIVELTKSMSNLSGIGAALTQYITDVMSGKEPHLDEGYWQVIMCLERYLLFNSVGEHPDADGWDQKYNAVLDAYLSDKTARDETKEAIRRKIEEEIQQIKQKIKEINECLKETFSIKKIKEYVQELADLYKRLEEISEELPTLPDTEELVDSYDDVLAEIETTTNELSEKVETLEATSGELKKQAEELEKRLKECQEQAEADYARIAELKAKSIWVDLTTKVTFPSESVSIAVSWESDEYADGYVLKVNGVVAEPKKTDTGYIYEESAAEVGKTYDFEVTPYVNYKGESQYGIATKASVTPKVTVKKSAVKSLKKGSKSFEAKWKKVSGASGYQISYKTGKKTVKKTVNGGSKTSLKVKNLKSGKKYTVKVRTWMKVNGKKYYSKWSSGKKVKVK